MNGNLEANSRARTGFGRGFSFGKAIVSDGEDEFLKHYRAYCWRPIRARDLINCLCTSIPYRSSPRIYELC